MTTASQTSRGYIERQRLRRRHLCYCCEKPHPGTWLCAACRVGYRLFADAMKQMATGARTYRTPAEIEVRIQVYRERASRRLPLFEGGGVSCLD